MSWNFELFGRLKDKNKDKNKGDKNRDPSNRRYSRSGAPSRRSAGGNRGNSPIQEVRNLSSQGYSENEIVNQLRDRGYEYPDIKQALNQALKARTQGQSPDDRQGSQGMGPDQYGGSGISGKPGAGGQPSNMGQNQGQGSRGGGPEALSQYEGGEQRSMMGQPQQEEEDEGGWMPSMGGSSEPAPQQYEEEIVPEDTEEMIEVIVSEKLIDIEDEFDKVHSKMEELSEKVDEVENRVQEIEIRKDEDESKFLTKVNEMEDYLETSQSRIGGLEKALQQVLPSLVDNVRELTSLVQDMKEDNM